MRKGLFTIFVLHPAIIFAFPTLELKTWQITQSTSKESATIEFPRHWNTYLDKQNLTAEVTLSSTLPSVSQTDEVLVLSLGMIGIADKVYVNGTLVGATGGFPNGSDSTDYREFAWHVSRVYFFPASLFNRNGKNRIDVRVYSHIATGISQTPLLETQANFKMRTAWQKLLSPFAEHTFYLLTFGLLVCLLTALYSYGRNEMLLPVFALGVSCLCRSALLLGTIPFANGLLRAKVAVGFFPVVDLAMLFVVQRFLKIKTRWLWFLIFTPLGILWFVSTSSENTGQLVLLGGAVFLTTVALYLGIIFFWAARAAYRDPLRYWYLVPFGVMFFVGACRDFASAWNLDFNRIQTAFIWRFPQVMALFLLFILFDFRHLRIERDALLKRIHLPKPDPTKIREKKVVVERKTNPVLENIVAYLDTNFREPYDRKQLARQFHLNEDYLLQVFKKGTGTNIANYLNNKRVAEAKRLLTETQSRVIDIAFHVGYDNLTYFYRQFKLINRQSPTAYRRALKTTREEIQ